MHGQDFLLTKRKYEASPPKKDRVWLRSCIEIAGKRDTVPYTKGSGGRRPTMASGRTPQQGLLRRRVSQGPPYKCPVIREFLWDWFVDVRRSVAANISPKLVLLKAKSIAEEVLKAQRTSGCYTPLPIIDKHWLLRWKRDKGVVFRKPNLRFKASKGVMTVRLRAMWINSIKVRRLAQRLLHKDLSDSMYGIDEKPLHFNESGSKNVRSLEIVGAPAVQLKENHAATRERVSVMTLVTSSLAAVNQPRGLPVSCSRESSRPRARAVFRAWRALPYPPRAFRSVADPPPPALVRSPAPAAELSHHIRSEPPA